MKGISKFMEGAIRHLPIRKIVKNLSTLVIKHFEELDFDDSWRFGDCTRFVGGVS